MSEELLKILERIASALEKIANSLNKENIEISQECVNSEFSAEYVSNDEIEIGNEAIKERQHIIEEFLTSRKITIKHIPFEEEGNEIQDKISIFMGNKYNLIKPFIDQVKLKMNSGGTIRMDLKNEAQEKISAICQLAHNLYEIAFLEEFTYLRSPKYLLFATPNRIPVALNFFSGKWLEKFIKNQIVSLIKQVNPNLKFSYISNPQIELPNKDDFELDFLLEVEGEIFWVEAKTGDYQRYVGKYSKTRKTLDLDANHSFMILTDITESGAVALKGLFGMNVVKIEKFSEAFLDLIIKYQISDLTTTQGKE